MPASVHAQKAVEYAKPVSTKLNTTGRVLNMPVPLTDEGQTLGEIVVRINPDDSVMIPQSALLEKLAPLMDKSASDRLAGVQATNGQVTVAALKAAGFDVRFDQNAFELVFKTRADDRPVGDLSLGGFVRPGISSTAAKPAIFAGYLNVIAGVDHRWGDVTGSEGTSGRLDLQSVFRLYNVVLENEFGYEGLVDTFKCPTSAICTYEHQAGFKRQRSRLVYDMPDSTIRVQVGDADVYGTGVQRAPDVLGVTIEKSPRKLRPGESIRPTGRSSFRIERSSDVEVVVNGAIVQRFRLRAGNYNLTDLPLATGANEIQLVITDDSGERRALAFTTYFDATLLGAGKSEWSASAGVPSYFKDGERAYRTKDEAFASGFFRYGISNQTTGEIHAQADQDVVMAGVGVFSMTPWGAFGLQPAVSHSESGTGYAVTASWDLVNFRGPFAYYSQLRESVRLGAEYRSTDFRAPGEFLATASGILYPQYNYWLRLSGAYTVPFSNGVALTLAGRYQFANDKALELSPYTLKGDRYGVDLTVSSALTPTLSGSVTVGYSNESYLFSDTSDRDQAEFRVMARLFWRPTDNSRIAASYDSLNRDTYISAYTGAGRGIDRWDASVDVASNDRTGNTSATGAVSYYGNRAETRLAHTSGFDGVGFGSFDPKSIDQRTSARIGTSIAFADGAVAIGQPIRGNGFAIVTPHNSIAGKTVVVGSDEDVRARADKFGPGVVTDIPAYTNMILPVDVADLPVGYSLGTGAFETHAPYRGGYKLEVGSAYSVSAVGTLLHENGDPLALISGVAYPEGIEAKQVAVFTNASGRFGADGLAPGKWIIDMASDSGTKRYVIVVPSGTQGLFRAGTLKPAGRG